MCTDTTCALTPHALQLHKLTGAITSLHKRSLRSYHTYANNKTKSQV